MSKRNYDEAKVVKSLSKKTSIAIDYVQKAVYILIGHNDIGIGSWGKIDFLVHYCKYNCYRCNTLPKSKSISMSSTIGSNDNTVTVRKTKRDKFSMAKMVTSSMKKAKTK